MTHSIFFLVTYKKPLLMQYRSLPNFEHFLVDIKCGPKTTTESTTSTTTPENCKADGDACAQDDADKCCSCSSDNSCCHAVPDATDTSDKCNSPDCKANGETCVATDDDSKCCSCPGTNTCCHVVQGDEDQTTTKCNAS